MLMADFLDVIVLDIFYHLVHGLEFIQVDDVDIELCHVSVRRKQNNCCNTAEKPVVCIIKLAS